MRKRMLIIPWIVVSMVLAWCWSNVNQSQSQSQSSASDIQPQPEQLEMIEWCIEWQCFELEVADTPETRSAGLMNRAELADDRWMLFVFDEPGRHAFWMKNTLIPLDVIRVGVNDVIVDIQTLQPCLVEQCPSAIPSTFASYVIELNAWSWFSIWDTVVLNETN